MSEWQPITTSPPHPMGVLFYSRTLTFWSETEAEIRPQPQEFYDIGHWDGTSFLWSMSNHEVFEFPSDVADENKPTHWQPLPEPPEAS